MNNWDLETGSDLPKNLHSVWYLRADNGTHIFPGRVTAASVQKTIFIPSFSLSLTQDSKEKVMFFCR